MTSRPHVYDCFTFFNELDLLEIRLVELSEVVDRFVLVEAVKTFQGNPKPLYFQENRERFKPWLDKIEHVVVDFPSRITIRPDRNATWNREFYQRNQIARGLAGAAPHDLVMVSDVDEIVARDVFRAALNGGDRIRHVTGFVMPMHHLYMCCRTPDFRWTGPRMVEFKSFSTAQQLRSVRFEHETFWSKIGLGVARIRLRNWERCGVSRPLRLIENAGWHFTSIGGYDAWKQKVESYSHEEYKSTFTGQHDVLNAVRGYEVASLETMPILVREQPWRFEGLLTAPSRLAA